MAALTKVVLQFPVFNPEPRTVGGNYKYEYDTANGDLSLDLTGSEIQIRCSAQGLANGGSTEIVNVDVKNTRYYIKA